ncbi:MAG TPA: NAD(P)/FAD-dependent oxidoreductase [Mycobacterium sp.]|jgi:cation diffusion facilitator CzcD-associated flavoprotein CzcO|nr:NAD(P)/FAD-dependent oxidoreductase [Mycobacterium sp.]
MAVTADRRNAVTIIGAGFGGICMGIKLRRAGIPFTILEKGDRVGGVWRDNTYPGAACDIPSHLYSYSFEPSHDWSRKYGTQPEIQSYIDQCAHRYGVVERVRFGQAVKRADFDEDSSQWTVTLDDGGTVDSRFLVAATGQLSLPADPKFPGLESFGGKVFHSARWDHDYDLRGKRVAVVGTGASAIQFVPQIAPRVAQLYVLQRSAPYVLPKPDRPYTPLEKYLYRHFPAMLVASRSRQYAYHEARVLPLTKGIGVNAIEKAWERYFHAQITDDRLRELLRPDYAIGCKRVLISNDWYAGLSRPNVEVIPAGLTEVRRDSIVAADGSERDVDTIIFGTGFATNDFLAPMSVTGRDGREIHEVWGKRGGADAFKGISVPGFPNLFMLYGPNTNLGHNSIIYMLETQTDYVVEALRHAASRGAKWLDVRPEAHTEFNDDLQQQLKKTVWQAGCDSWYVTDAGKNTNNWPSFTFDYRRQVRYFDPVHYQTDAAPLREPAPVRELARS